MSTNLITVRADPSMPLLSQYHFPVTSVVLNTVNRVDTGAAVTATPVSGFQGPGTWLWSYDPSIPGVVFTYTLTFNDGTQLQASGRANAFDGQPPPPQQPSNLTGVIAEAATMPKQTTVDGQATTEQSLPDLIAADKYQKANAAAAQRGLPVKLVQFLRPGTSEGRGLDQRFFDDPNWR